MCGSSTPQRRRRRARNGRKGFGAFLNHAVGGLTTYLGVPSQALDRIGANGFMVVRLRVSCLRDAGSCRLERQASRKKGVRTFFGLSINIHTQTVPGSHRALPGDLGGGRGEPRSAPTSACCMSHMHICVTYG